jgi:hypothetical protein
MKRHTCSEEPRSSHEAPHERQKTYRPVQKQSLHAYASHDTPHEDDERTRGACAYRAIAADSAAQVNARHALKLRVVRHKYTARIAAHARAMERHAHKLVRLHARI